MDRFLWKSILSFPPQRSYNDHSNQKKYSEEETAYV